MPVGVALPIGKLHRANVLQASTSTPVRGETLRKRASLEHAPGILTSACLMCIICQAAIFEIASKATTTPVASAVSRVFAFLMKAGQSIAVDQKTPGGNDSPQGLILFDGVCVLCSRGCQFREQT
jgi:hypothetical protein